MRQVLAKDFIKEIEKCQPSAGAVKVTLLRVHSMDDEGRPLDVTLIHDDVVVEVDQRSVFMLCYIPAIEV